MKQSAREEYLGSRTLVPEIAHLGHDVFAKATPGGLPSHIHGDSYEICCIVEGHVDWWVGDQVIEVGAGQIFITRPDEPHGGVNAVMHANELYWIQVRLAGARSLPGLDRRGAAEILERFVAMKLRTFPAPSGVSGLFERILQEHRQSDALSVALVRATLHQLLIDVLRAHDEQAKRLRHSSRAICPRIGQALRQIDQNLGEPLSLSELAAALEMSVSHFRQRFAREVGKSPGQYIVQQRIRRAKELLRDPRQSITTISHELGFASSQHFATTFRQWVGLPPTEYRRSLNQPLHEAGPSHD